MTPTRRGPGGPSGAWPALSATATTVLLAAALTACGGSSGSDSSGSDRPAARGATTAPAGDTIRVGLTEWEILTSVTTVPSGSVSFRVTNAGATEHDLVVQGRAGTWRTDDLAPGAVQRLTIRATRGESLRLWCSEPGHEVQGMHTTLRVPG